MMRSALGKGLSVVSWLVTGLSAVNEGLRPFGHDFYKLQFMLNHPQAALYLQYAVGIAGVISLLMLASACVCKGASCCGSLVCPKCGASPCVCPHVSGHHNKI
ncbi:MAG: hypothetical protein P4L31_01200 [Candidatus Babeliales bacterium]|nr:hypothetical protein [Candidatus Babeliales bacterium]